MFYGQGRTQGKLLLENRLVHKIGSTRIGKSRIFRNHKITGKDSICSKKLKLIENKGNKRTYRSENKSLFVQTRTSDHHLQ